LRDTSEFWSYIRKNGIIHFLVFTYDEMKDRTDIDNSEGSNLSDEFAIIK
jgi:inositol 1,4,5-triphosphate receptor type 1